MEMKGYTKKATLAFPFLVGRIRARIGIIHARLKGLFPFLVGRIRARLPKTTSVTCLRSFHSL